MSNQNPTSDELAQHRLTAFKGIDVGLGYADPGAAICAKLEAKYPGYLILVQAGTFLHSYDRSAYALATLKKYKLKLIGTATDPHIRVGFPAGNFKRRLGESREELLTICEQITAKLASDGIPFLGYIVWPNHISAGRYVRSRYHQRLRQHESGGRDRTDALRSYRAMLNHTGSTR